MFKNDKGKSGAGAAAGTESGGTKNGGSDTENVSAGADEFDKLKQVRPHLPQLFAIGQSWRLRLRGSARRFGPLQCEPKVLVDSVEPRTPRVMAVDLPSQG